MANYILTIRPLEEIDASPECPTLCEPDDFEMYADALVQDIQNIKTVTSASRDSLSISIQASIAGDDLEEQMKPLFSNLFCDLRYVSLED